MSSSLNETELQQLIDGELDLPATKQLLKLAETDPDQWREIAVAFVEDRLWQRSFQKTNSMKGASNEDALRETPSRVSPKPETAPRANPAPIATKVGPPSWLALAAGLLLAVGVGYLAGSRPSFDSNADIATNEVVADGDQNVPSSPATEITLADLQPEYQLELTDAMGIDKSSVPLYSARKLNQLPQAQRRSFAGAQLSDRQRQQLRQSGVQFQQNVDYLSGRLQDGRTFIVPVRTVNLSSGQ